MTESERRFRLVRRTGRVPDNSSSSSDQGEPERLQVWEPLDRLFAWTVTQNAVYYAAKKAEEGTFFPDVVDDLTNYIFDYTKARYSLKTILRTVWLMLRFIGSSRLGWGKHGGLPRQLLQYFERR